MIIKIFNKIRAKALDTGEIVEYNRIELHSGGTLEIMDKNSVFYSYNLYENISDEELVNKSKSGDKHALEFLLEKYKELVNMKVSKYFIIGAEKEDIVQEGMIGLYKAVKSYSNDKQNSFKSFANMCIERQLITAIKSSNRQKHLKKKKIVALNLLQICV